LRQDYRQDRKGTSRFGTTDAVRECRAAVVEPTPPITTGIVPFFATIGALRAILGAARRKAITFLPSK
jgi:hypothetical protein